MKTLTWDYDETGDPVCVQTISNADAYEPECPLCGKKTEYWEVQIDQDIQGNDIYGWNWCCWDCGISTPLEYL